VVSGAGGLIRGDWIVRARSSDWLALPVLLAGTFMIVLDFFIVNVTVLAMQRDLHASATAIEWVVAGYGLTFALFLIVAGRLGDRIGRRRMFSIGLRIRCSSRSRHFLTSPGRWRDECGTNRFAAFPSA
jgi:MFS family permease